MSQPSTRLAPPKLQQYAGLKEEYYLSDFEPDPSVLEEWGIDPARVLVVLRPPPDVSLYHRHANPLFPETLRALGGRDDVHAVVLPRIAAQRDFVRSLDLPSVIVPELCAIITKSVAKRRTTVSMSATV